MRKVVEHLSIDKEKPSVAQRCKPVSKEQTREKDKEKEIRGAKAMTCSLVNSQQGHRRYEHGEDDLDGRESAVQRVRDIENMEPDEDHDDQPKKQNPHRSGLPMLVFPGDDRDHADDRDDLDQMAAYGSTFDPDQQQ